MPEKPGLVSNTARSACQRAENAALVIRFGTVEYRTGVEFYFLAQRNIPPGGERLLERLVGTTVVVRDGRVETGQGPLAQSYARHLGKAHPGAWSVTLSVQEHLIPDPARVDQQLRASRRTPDLDAPEFYTVPERIGEYPCDTS